jgi:hypothetical protein
LNVASKSKLYFIHDIMNNICHNKQQKWLEITSYFSIYIICQKKI